MIYLHKTVNSRQKKMSWRYKDPAGLAFDKSTVLLLYERKITKQSSITATKSLPSHLCHE